MTFQPPFLFQLSKNFCSFFERTAKVRDSLFHAKFFSSSTPPILIFHISFYSANILSKNFLFSHRFFNRVAKIALQNSPPNIFCKRLFTNAQTHTRQEFQPINFFAPLFFQHQQKEKNLQHFFYKTNIIVTENNSPDR